MKRLASRLGALALIVGVGGIIFGTVLYASNNKCSSIDARMQLCTRTLQDIEISNIAVAIVLAGLGVFVLGALILRRRSLLE